MPLLPNPHAITDLCLNLKMYVTIGNRGLIWKYERYARKSPNNATTNQTNLKNSNSGRVAKWVKALQMNWKVLGSKPNRCLSRFREPNLLRGP